jgi:hypothetical protein
MSQTCILNDGYDLGCFGTGGVKNIYIANYTSSAAFTLDANDIITTASNAGTYYQFEQDIESALFNETINPSRENGTVFYESTVSIKMFNNDADVRNLVKALAKAPLSVLIEDNNGGYWLMGTETAVRATEGSRGFGQAFGDMNGAMLTFTYKSAEPVPSVLSTIVGSQITLG